VPGAPWTKLGKPIAERSTAEIVGVFVVLPILLGGVIMTMVIRNAVANAAEFGATEWFWQVVFVGLLGLIVALGPPAAALQEFRRRREHKDGSAETSSPADQPRV
jgi:hypothetical protein